MLDAPLFHAPYQQRALDKMLWYKRSIIQSGYGMGTRDVQFVFARQLLATGQVDRVVVIAPKTLFGVWQKYIGDSDKFLLVSNVSIRMHSYRRDDFSRDVVLIDIGVSGRHTAAVISHLFSEIPVWLCSRWPALPGLLVGGPTEEDPIYVSPSPIGQRQIIPKTWN